MSLFPLAAAAALAFAGQADAQFEELDRKSEAACLRAAALDQARIGPPTRFSSDLMLEARIVDGVAEENAARTSLLCLYHRTSGLAEVKPFDPRQTLAPSQQVTDVWWHARLIGGRPVIGTDVVTLMLGPDGRISGRSGCNLYSAQYRLIENAIEVVWPMTGTRRACQPVIEAQEDRFRQIVLRAMSVRIAPDGSMLLTSRTGQTIQFVRAESEMRRPD